MECAISLEDFTAPSPPPGFDIQPLVGSTDLQHNLAAASPTLSRPTKISISVNHRDADGMLVNAADEKAPTTPQSSSPLSSPIYTPECSPIGEL